MLNSLLFFIFNSIYGLLKLLSRLLAVDSFFALVRTTFEPVDGFNAKKQRLVVPSHLAVDLVEADCTTWKQLFDLIMYASVYGVRRISLYDPYSVLKENKGMFLKFLKAHLKRKNSTVVPVADFEHPPADSKSTSSFIHLSILGAEDSRGALVQTCKNLCHLDREIVTSDIDEQLTEQSIFEPDLLLKLGAVDSLAGYPPWSLRVTEIVSLPRFSCESGVGETEFTKILADFSSRDRRLGK